MKEKAKIKKNSGAVRVISNKEENLIKLREELTRLFCIKSNVNKSINGIGTTYFELNINKQEDVKKLINNGLLSQDEKEKWLKSRE